MSNGNVIEGFISEQKKNANSNDDIVKGFAEYSSQFEPETPIVTETLYDPKSKYDISYLSRFGDIMEHRARQQSVSAKWGNAIPKIVGTAVASFAEPFVDLTIQEEVQLIWL